ncbi:MAG: hypothetical protein HC933_13545 [Pleurocapsa sp. SU_196_0]|nr:hypothetical protein [Pleurocapsa sp. SU_196_0]
MEFIETSTFTKRIRDLLNDEDYRALQNELVLDPTQGDLIRGTHGLRKLRASQGDRGKRGGLRSWYFHATARDIIFLLFVLPKNKASDLTKQMEQQLAALVRKEFP